jgi:cytochrome c oxidase cbb3-type subunit 3
MNMADLPGSFWGGWITLLTVVSLAGLVWLLFSIYFSREENHQADVVWDETLNEGAQPAPLWWFWLILAALVFSVIYLMLYPGLGTYSGALHWSQGHRLEQSYALYREHFADLRQTIDTTPLAALQGDEFLMRTARGIYNRECSVCHGPDAAGQAATFPDLTDTEWQWGGSPERIEASIRHGRRSTMPAWGNILSADQVDQLIQYIRGFGEASPADNLPGRAVYGQYCTGCHGVDGTGNTAIGAADLTDDAWLYGDAELARSITDGRTGVMPAFQGRLDDIQIRLLVAWLTWQRQPD